MAESHVAEPLSTPAQPARATLSLARPDAAAVLARRLAAASAGVVTPEPAPPPAPAAAPRPAPAQRGALPGRGAPVRAPAPAAAPDPAATAAREAAAQAAKVERRIATLAALRERWPTLFAPDATVALAIGIDVEIAAATGWPTAVIAAALRWHCRRPVYRQRVGAGAPRLHLDGTVQLPAPSAAPAPSAQPPAQGGAAS